MHLLAESQRSRPFTRVSVCLYPTTGLVGGGMGSGFFSEGRSFGFSSKCQAVVVVIGAISHQMLQLHQKHYLIYLFTKVT
jgi:hypothetical protein